MSAYEVHDLERRVAQLEMQIKQIKDSVMINARIAQNREVCYQCRLGFDAKVGINLVGPLEFISDQETFPFCSSACVEKFKNGNNKGFTYVQKQRSWV